MLRREHAIAEYRGGKIIPDRLGQKQHGHYLGYAQHMLRIYETGMGQTRQDLHRAIWSVFANEPDCPARRIEALCKLLDDQSDYEQDRGGKAAELRRKVFRMAADKHPLLRRADRLFGTEEATVKAEIAQKLGRPWKEIETDLFADVFEFRRLKRFEGYENAQALLARYNVAQVQVALFDAESMTVWATDDFKTILRYAKLARLMHTIQRHGGHGYAIRFDGPASVLRTTRRYGVAMARFLPGLLACREWRMHAVLRTRRRGWNVALDVSADEGLTSHVPTPDDFDSSVEEAFAAKWGEDPRDGWQLVREGGILHQQQKVFVPDFLFRHEDGRTALMEIVGYWTPEYLEAKQATLRLFADHPILLAVSQQVRQAMPEMANMIPYKTVVPVKSVLQMLNNQP